LSNREDKATLTSFPTKLKIIAMTEWCGKSIDHNSMKRRRTVKQWTDRLIETYRVNECCRYQSECFSWLALDHDLDDVDIYAWGEAFQKHPHLDALYLELLSGFTEHGAHVLAAFLSRQSRINVYLNIDYEIQPMTIAKILFLESNQPLIHHSHYPLRDAIDLLTLQHHVNRATFPSGNPKHDPILECHDGEVNVYINLDAKTMLSLLEGAHALTAEKRSSNITQLRFTDHRYDPGKHLHILYQNGIQASRRLFQIVLEHPAEGSMYWASVLPSIKKIAASFERKSEPLKADIIEVLQHTSALLHLDLHYCHLNDETMRSLSNGLRRLTSIQHLELRNNIFGDEGLTLLAHSLIENSSLKILELQFNNFGPIGVKALMTAVVKHRAMVELHLNDCPNIGHAGIQLIANAMPNMTLKRLFFFHCTKQERFSSDDKEAMQGYDATKAKTRHCVIDGMKANYYITYLNVSDNDGILRKPSLNFVFTLF
jgi:hypothetical protein